MNWVNTWLSAPSLFIQQPVFSDAFVTFRSGKLTPSEVGECVIKRIEELKARKLDLNIVTQYDPQDIREVCLISTLVELGT